MVKKLKAYEESPSGYKNPENLMQDKINELVDVVNNLQTSNAHIQKDLCEMRHPEVKTAENVQDKFAEQRKWIGKLCKFWDFVYEHDYFDTLKGITDDGLFIGHNGSWKYCQPVNPDDDVIYKGDK